MMSLSSKVLKGVDSGFARPYILADVVPDIVGEFQGADSCVEEEVGISEERISEIEREAYVRGFEAGEKAGIEAGLESGYREASSLIKTASCMIGKLEDLRKEILERSEEEILRLSLAVARKVVRAEGMLNREAVVPLIKAAAKKLTYRDSVRVRLNPLDAEWVLGKKAGILADMDGVKEMAIEEDISVSPGGCIVEAGLAEVDARLERQLEEIASALLKGSNDHD